MLALCREDPGGECLLAVVDEELNRARIDVSVDLLKRILKRHLEGLEDLLVEPDVHAGAVDRELIGSRIVGDREPAGSVRLREEVQESIALAEAGRDMAGLRKDSGFGGIPGFELCDLRDRRLDQLAVPDAELARQAHGALPLLGLGRVVVVRESQPCDEDRLVRIRDIGRALSRIEIEPEIEVLVITLRREGQRVVVHAADEIDVVVGGVSAARQSRVLRGENENILAADIHDAGALPHPAEVLVAGNLQLAGEAPAGKKLLRLVDESGSLLVQSLGADEDVVFLLLGHIDDLRVALVLGVVVPRAEERLFELLELAVGVHLRGAGEGGADPVLVAVVAGVEEIEVVAEGERGAGMAALVVIEVAGRDADAGVVPAHKVRADRVIPVFQSVNGTPRCPLVIEVPLSFVIGKSVRVRGKTGHRLNVVGLAVTGFLNAFIEVRDLVRAYEHSVAFFESPLLHG